MPQALNFCKNCIQSVLDGEIIFTEETTLCESSISECANSHLNEYAEQIVHYEEG